MLNRLVFFSCLFLSLSTARSALAEDAKVKVATCRDGKDFYTSSVGRDGKPSHMGACSGHGGVATWADGSPVKSHERKTEYR